MPTTSLRIWQRRSMRSKVVRAAALMAAAISAGPVAQTVVGGRVVFQSDKFAQP